MSKIEIAQSGEVIVDPSIKGGFADPALPLAIRLEKLGLEISKMDFDGIAKVYSLVFEAADIVRSNQTAAERRASAQRNVQKLLHHSQAEIRFLRQYIEGLGGTPRATLAFLGGEAPEFIAPSPYEGSREAYEIFVKGSGDGRPKQS